MKKSLDRLLSIAENLTPASERVLTPEESGMLDAKWLRTEVGIATHTAHLQAQNHKIEV